MRLQSHTKKENRHSRPYPLLTVIILIVTKEIVLVSTPSRSVKDLTVETLQFFYLSSSFFFSLFIFPFQKSPSFMSKISLPSHTLRLVHTDSYPYACGHTCICLYPCESCVHLVLLQKQQGTISQFSKQRQDEVFSKIVSKPKEKESDNCVNGQLESLDRNLGLKKLEL